MIVRRRFLRRLLLLFGAIGLAFAAVHTNAVKQMLRRAVSAQATALVNGTVSIGRLDYRLWLGEVELSDIAIVVPPELNAVPFELAADRVLTRVSFPSSVTFELDEPELTLINFFDTPVTDYGAVLAKIRQALVTNGTIRFQDHDESGELNEWLAATQLDVTMNRVDNGHRVNVHAAGGHANQVPFNLLDADIVLPPGAVELRSVSLFKDDSFARASGALDLSDGARGDIDIDFALDGALAKLLDASLEVDGVIEGRTALRLSDTTNVDTELRSDALTWNGVLVENLASEVSVDPDSIDVRRFEASGFGGSVALEGAFSLASEEHAVDITWSGINAVEATRVLSGETLPVKGRIGGSAHIALSDLDISSARATARLELEPGSDVVGAIETSLADGLVTLHSENIRVPEFQATLEIDGTTTLDGELDLTVDGAVNDLSQWETRLELDGTVLTESRVEGNVRAPRVTGELGSRALLVEGEPYELSGAFRTSAEQFHLDGASLSGERGAVRLDGAVPFSEAGSWELDVSLEGNAHATATIRGSAASPDWTTNASVSLADVLPGANGRVALRADGGGPVDAPRGRVDVSVEDLVFRDTALPGFRVALELEDDAVALEGSRDDGTSLASGLLRLSEDFPLHAELQLDELPLEQLAETIPFFRDRDDLTWSIGGTAIVDVPLQTPDDLSYRVDVVSLEAGLDGAVTASAAPFTIEGDLDRVRVSNLAFHGIKNRLVMSGVLPLSPTAEFDLTADAFVELEMLQLLNEDLKAEGTAVFDGSVSGPRDNPQIIGAVRVAEASGTFRSIAWSELELDAVASEDWLRDISLTANALGGRIALEGNMPISSEVEQAGRVDFRIEDVDLLLDQDYVSVTTTVLGSVEIPELTVGALRGRGTVENLRWSSGEWEMSLEQTSGWEMEAAAISLPQVALVGGGSRVALGLDIGGLDDTVTVDGSLAGRFDLGIANSLLEGTGAVVNGQIELDVAASARDGTIGFTGGGALENGDLVIFDPNFSMSDVNTRFSLDGRTAALTDLSARVGTGELEAYGSIDFSDLAAPIWDLRAKGAGVPLQLMTGLRMEVSGDVRLATSDGEERLEGALTIDNALLTRELDDDDSSFSTQQISLADPTLEPSALDALALDVAITTARNIRVENSIAQMEMSGNLLIQGTLAAPEAGGSVALMPDGQFNVGRNRFQIVQGRIDLDGFPLSLPSVRMNAVTRVGATAINIDIEGDTDDLRTRLTAPESPDLTEGDLASLLVTGRTLENAGEGGAQMASTWMMSSMANLMHDGLGDLISFGPPPGAGPLILSEEADPTSRLTVGVPVTDRLSVTYSIALDSSERRMWILDYRIARNFWVRGIQENSDDYAIGVSQRFQFDWRKRPTTRASSFQRETVAGVSIAGAPASKALEVDIKSGDNYDYWNAQDAGLALRNALIADGFKSAVVDVNVTPNETGSLDLSFDINAGERIEFVWLGDEPGDALRQIVESSWDGRIPESFLLADLTAEMQATLRSERYYLAQASGSVAEIDGKRQVRFEIVRGPQGSDFAIQFEGNDSIDTADLAEALPPADSPEMFLVLERPKDLERGIRLRYAASGFLDVKVGEPQTRFNVATGLFDILIPVDEGAVTPVATVELEGAETLDVERLLSEFAVELGTPILFPEIRRGAARIRDHYRNQGFPDAKVKTAMRRTVAGLDVTIRIDEGPHARIGEVRIVGNNRTHPVVVRNELTFDTGAMVRHIDFQETQRRLYDLAIFRSADVRVDPEHRGRPVQDVVIRVVERSDLDVNYGLRYNFIGNEQSVNLETEPRSEGLEAVARVNFVNQFGRGTNIGVSAFYQAKFHLFRTTLRMPTFFRQRIITEFSAETERDLEELSVTSFETRGESFTFQQTKKLTDNIYEKFALQWNFRWGRFRGQRFTNDKTLSEVNATRPRLGFSIIEDRRDSFANPSHGRFWNITFQGVPEAWSSDVGYVRVYGQFFYYYPITRSIVWASGMRLGVAKGTDELILMEDRFQSGGANSVRGFRQNTLGPSIVIAEARERIYVGGQAVSVFNQEVRFPIYKALHAGAYWDAGNVFARAKDFRFADLRHSVGAGLRFVLPFGAIRFDWAEVLNAHPEDETTRFHFSFGYAF